MYGQKSKFDCSIQWVNGIMAIFFNQWDVTTALQRNALQHRSRKATVTRRVLYHKGVAQETHLYSARVHPYRLKLEMQKLREPSFLGSCSDCSDAFGTDAGALEAQAGEGGEGGQALDDVPRDAVGAEVKEEVEPL
jgi:hypothetical protein